MWIVIGTGTKTEHVPGGARVERECSACGELATFAERRVTRTLRLYFLDVFEMGAERVMACGVCGTLFATDDPEAAERTVHGGWRGTLDAAAGEVSDAVEKAGHALSPMLERAGAAVGPLAKRAADGASSLAGAAVDEVGPLARDAGERVGAMVRGGRRSHARRELESERENDPEKRALLRRFEALEGKRDARPPSPARRDTPRRELESERETDPEKRALLRRFEALERELEKKRSR